MSDRLIDTNVIVRYLVEEPATIDAKFRGVYDFFAKLEKGTIQVRLCDLVLFQVYFVLTSYYRVPRAVAAEKLRRLVGFKGLRLAEKDVAVTCLRRLEVENLDIVDAYLLAWSDERGTEGVYTFDADLRKKGLKLLKVV
jgi:predicted nucleic acid-binding protein